MLEKDVKQASIARALGVSAAMVSYVVSGDERSAPIENHIAKQLGKDAADIWPLEKEAMAA